MKKFFYYIGIYAVCTEIHNVLSNPKHIMANAKGVARDCRQIVDIVNGKEIKDESEGEFRPKKVMNKIGF